MLDIERGTRIDVRDVTGRPIRSRALGGVVVGDNGFYVVWACPERAQAEGREPVGDRWPVETTTVVREAP